MQEFENIQSVASGYDGIFCDVWGVLHNGVEAYREAVDALRKLKAANKVIVLLTNSPRPAEGVEQQLQTFGITSDAFDCIVTSGDATRHLISEAPRKILHIGPSRDLSLFSGIAVELVEEQEAEAIVCTGLFDEESESPDDYRELLLRLKSRHIPFICANPDIVVEHGSNLLWCAGALARLYTQIGGRTLIAGKPHQAIYELAYRRALALKPTLGRNILAIGDGLLTDIKGADQFGIDAVFIANGIHASEYTSANKIDKSRLQSFVDSAGFAPIGFMQALR